MMMIDLDAAVHDNVDYNDDDIDNDNKDDNDVDDDDNNDCSNEDDNKDNNNNDNLAECYSIKVELLVNIPCKKNAMLL